MKEYIFYTGSVLAAVGTLLVASGVESAGNGWEALGYTCGAFGMMVLAMVLAALGCRENQKTEEMRAQRRKRAQRVQDRRRAG